MKNEVLRQMKKNVVRVVFFVLMLCAIKLFQQRGFDIGDLWILLVIIILYTVSAIFRARIEVLRKEDELAKKEA